MRIAMACLDPGIPLDGTKGAAVHFRSLVRALAERGHRLDVIAMRGGAVEGASTVTLVPNGGAAARQVILDLDRDAAAGAFDAVYERLALRAEGAGEAARSLSIPHVLEVNAPLADESARWRNNGEDPAAAREAEARTVAGADAVLPVSSALAEWAVGLGAARSAVRVVRNGVDPVLFAPRPRAPRQAGDPFTIGFVGSLKAWHGLDLLARALLLGARAGQDHWRARIVGDGPERAAFARRLDEGGYRAERVEFVGAIRHEEVPAQTATFDAAVVPYEDLPGFYFSPLKLYEALALGVPVLASASGDVVSELDGGRLGELFPPGDANALFAALRSIDENPAEALARARVASDVIRRERSWARNAEAVESVIRSRKLSARVVDREQGDERRGGAAR